MPEFTIDPHELEQLLNYCVDFAKKMLEKKGDFLPFGAALGCDGKQTGIGGYAGEEARGPAIYDLLQQGMRSQFEKGEILAAALAANVNIPATYEPTYADGIRVLLECQGFARFVYLPYRLHKRTLGARLLGSHSRVEYAEFLPVDTEPTLWRPRS